jgi:hypothetical protein
MPPQPSLSPQAFPLQFGVHPQPPVTPPPPQVFGALHALQAEPAEPQAVDDVPARHWAPAQQPVHEVSSQMQLPPAQCRPAVQLPVMHEPPQPSLSPHAAPAH